ncbi:SMI1/KNR4 family protein [Pseudomonas syringae]|nr:SMI1/KNR4 family protein [Pseudomonas syringae]
MPITPQAFTECLATIEKLLPPDSLATLRPPASETSIQQIEQLLGAPLPLGLRQLLLWHDGQEWNAELRESDNRRLLAASEIMDALKFFLDPEEEFCEPWERYWVPFLTNDSGDYVVVDASPSGTGELIHYWHDWDDRSIAYPSLNEWAQGLKEELSQ